MTKPTTTTSKPSTQSRKGPHATTSKSGPMKAVHEPSTTRAEKKSAKKSESGGGSSTTIPISRNKVASTPMHDRHMTFFEPDMSVIDHLRRRDRGDEADEYNGTLCFPPAIQEDGENNDENHPTPTHYVPPSNKKITQDDLNILYAQYLRTAVIRRRHARAARDRQNRALEDLSKVQNEVVEIRERNDQLRLENAKKDLKIKLHKDLDQQKESLTALNNVLRKAAGNYVSTCRNIDAVSHVLPLNGVREPNNDELAVEIEALSETIDENLNVVGDKVRAYPEAAEIMRNLNEEVAQIKELAPKVDYEVNKLQELTNRVDLLSRMIELEKMPGSIEDLPL